MPSDPVAENVRIARNMQPYGRGPSCECGERGLTVAEAKADRCAICHRDAESRAMIRQAREEEARDAE